MKPPYAPHARLSGPPLRRPHPHPLTHLLPLWLMVTLLSTTAQAAEPRPLRQHHSILEYLDVQSITPPLPRHVPLECVGKQIHAPWPNPFTPLPRTHAQRHQRVTLTPGPAAVEFADALLIEDGHRLRFHLTGLEAPRLDLDYRVFRCGGAKGPLELRVTITDATGTTSSTHPISTNKIRATDPDAIAESAFHPFTLELPVAPNTPFLLDLEVVPTGGPNDAATPTNRASRANRTRTTRDASKNLIALANPTLSGLAPSPTPADTNVLWIVIDAVRHDAMGPGRTFATSASPELDRRAFARGTAFSHAYAMANQTRTSTVAMLASVPASIGGFHSHSWAFTSGKRESFYDRRPSLIPQTLTRYGFLTAHFGHNHFIWGSEVIGLDHGFTRAIDFRSVPNDAVGATRATNAFVTRYRDSRWMVMLNYTAPHTPYRPPDAFLEHANNLSDPPSSDKIGFLPRTYLGEILWVDHNLASVFATLQDLDLLDDTLVIVTADHGEVMNPGHDCSSPSLEQPCSFNHSLTVYDEEFRVPLALALPGRILENRVIDTPVSHADLAPTILELLGLPAAMNHVGRSLVPFLDGRGRSQDPIYVDGRLAAGIVLGNAKLIIHAAADDIEPRPRMIDGEPGRYELFDLDRDPLELDNLARSHRHLIAPILSTLDRYRSDMRARFAGLTRNELSVTSSPDSPDSPHSDGAPIASGSALNHLLITLNAAPTAMPPTVEAIIKTTTPGTLECLTPKTCRSLSPSSLALTLDATPETPTRVTFRSTPADTPLTVEGTLAATRLTTDRVRLGPWGLAFLRPGDSLTAANLTLANASTEPLPQPGESAVYLWRQLENIDALATHAPITSHGIAPAGSPEDGPGKQDSDAELRGEVKKILKDLGYTR